MHRVRFALEFVGCAAAGALVGVMFRHSDELYWALVIMGLGLCASFLAHLVLGLRARWKYHYVAICRFFALTLVAIIAFAVTANVTYKADQQVARDYLLQIKPQLESYRENFGHYPDALNEISGLPASPTGFHYRHGKDTVPGGPDEYRIDYFSEEYWSGSREWSDDD